MTNRPASLNQLSGVKDIPHDRLSELGASKEFLKYLNRDDYPGRNRAASPGRKT